MVKVLLFSFHALRLFFKLSGVKGGLLFGLGVLIGLLVAPQTGAELRARLGARIAGSDDPVDGDLLV